MENQNLIELGIDLALGRVSHFSANDIEISKDQAQDVLRNELLTLIDCKDGKFDYLAFERNQDKVFAIIREIVDVAVHEGIQDQFEGFVDYRNVEFGDKLQFRTRDDNWYEIATIAGGTNNLRRQRIHRGVPYTIDTRWYGAKIYEELELFLAGRIDWEQAINDVVRSFDNQIKDTIFTTIKAAYNGLDTPYKETGDFDIDKFNNLVAHVEAKTGSTPFVLGTRLALQKATPSYVTYGGEYMDARNRDGFFKIVDGISFVEIKQSHKIGTDEFLIDNNFLLVLPGMNEKIIKLVTEGRTLIKEVRDQDNADDSQEYVVRKKFGVGVEKTSKYGVYLLS